MNLKLLAPLSIGTAVAVAACGTPSDVRDYAKTSSAQMTSMRADLKGLTTREQGAMAIRRRAAALLLLTAQQGEIGMDQKLDKIRKAPKLPGGTCGASCSGTLLATIISRYQQQERGKADRARELQTFLDQLDSKKQTLPTATSMTALDNAAQMAGSLGDEMSKEELAAFLFDYFKQVKDGVEAGQKDATKAAGAAASATAGHP